MLDLLGTYTGTISVFWFFAYTMILIIVGYRLGLLGMNRKSYLRGLIDGRAAERAEWNDVNAVINKRVKAMTDADRHAYLSDGEAGPCPYDPQGAHDWHELRTIGLPPDERHYRCSFCMVAKTEKVLV